MNALVGGSLVFGSVGDGALFLDVADASFLLPIRWVAAMFLVSAALTAIDLLGGFVFVVGGGDNSLFFPMMALVIASVWRRFGGVRVGRSRFAGWLWFLFKVD